MPLPVQFASLAGGNQPASLFDTQFDAVAKNTLIPCSATGANTITLTPLANAVTVGGYQNYLAFSFFAAATSSASVQVQVGSLPALNAYIADGKTRVGSGMIAASAFYRATYASQLNGGSGGFVITGGSIGVGAAPVQLTPEQFGALGDGATDDTAAFLSLASSASSIGNVAINFAYNKTYVIWPNDASVTANPILCHFTGLQNSVINFNGSSFHSKYTTANISATCFMLDNCSGVLVNNYAHTSDRGKRDAGGGQNGVIHINPINGSFGIFIRRGTAVGGQTFLQCSRAAGAAGARCYDIDIDITVTDVFYPANLAFDGDYVRGFIKCTNAGRPFFPYNVKGFDITLDATNQTSQTLITVYANQASDTQATVGRIRIIDLVSTTGACDPLQVMWQQYGTNTSPQIAHIDVDIAIDIDQSSLGTAYTSMLLTASFTWSGGGGGSQVLGDPGHTGNIRFSGRVKGNTTGTFLDIARSVNGFANLGKQLWDVYDIQALDMTRPLYTGNGTNQRFSFNNVIAPSSTLTPDGAYPVKSWAVRNTLLSNLVPSNGTLLSSVTLFEPTNGGSISLQDSSGVFAGVLTTDTTHFYIGTPDARPLRLRSSSVDYIDLDTAGRWTPINDNVVSLGQSGKRYSAGWINAATINTVAFPGATSGSTTVQATAVAGSTTLTLPAATDTLVGKATTDTLTNKTFNSAGTGNTLQISGVTVSRGQIPGTNTNDAATAGNFGESVTSSVSAGSAVSMTTGVAANITSISLTAGDWDISIDGVFSFAGSANTTYVRVSVSTTSATLDVNPGHFGQFSFAAAGTVPGGNFTVQVPATRFSLSSTTTVFFVADSAFTVGTETCWGIIQARRMR